MSLITLTQACLAYGHVPLLDHVDFTLQSNQRLGLIGRNGTGKSSLLKILAGLEKPDDGRVQIQNGVRVAYVMQEPPLDGDHTIFEAVSEGLEAVKSLRARFEAHEEGDDLDAMLTQIEALDGWNWERHEL